MKAIILAGGRGVRLKPLTDQIPKPMIEMGGKPILWHIINHLKQYAVSDLIIALCYLPDAITKYFGDGRKFGVRIKYIFEDPASPLGTGGAIKAAEKLVGDTCIVTYGDILRDLNIKEMIKFHQNTKAFATLNIYKRESKGAKSKVYVDSKKRIIKFVERPETEGRKQDIWVNGSFYVFERGIFDFIPNKKSDFGSYVFPELIKSGKSVYGYKSTGYFVDIGNLKNLEFAKLRGKNKQMP